MVILDGRDVESALSSLAGSAGVTPSELSTAIHAHTERFGDTSDEPLAWRIEREVFAEVGVDVDSLAFDGAYYFHGTRITLGPDLFVTRGILPLNQILDEIWSALYELVADERSPHEWIEFRRSVESGAGWP